MSLESYCAPHSVDFLTPDHEDIGPCFRGIVFEGPLAVFLLWWGVFGRFVARGLIGTEETPQWTLPTLVDWMRLFLCLMLAVEGPLYLLVRPGSVAKHEWVDATLLGSLQWLFIGVVIVDEVRYRSRDTYLTTIATVLALLDKAFKFRSVVNDGDSVEHYTLARNWSLAALVVSALACFLITCVSRGRPPAAVEGDQPRYARVLSDAGIETPLLANERASSMDSRAEADKTPFPMDDAGLFNRLLFYWMDSIMRLGYQRVLEKSDFPNVPQCDESTQLTRDFERAYAEHPSVVHALYNGGVLRPFLQAAPLKFTYDTLMFVGPQLLRMLLTELNKDEPTGEELKIAGYMFAVACVQTLVLHAYFDLAFRSGMRVRAVIVSAVFKKALVLTPSERQRRQAGEIVNMLSTDAQRMQDLFPYLHVMWSSPYQVVLAVVFLWMELRWAVLVAIAVIVVAMTSLTGVLAARTKNVQGQLMKSKDARVRLTTEVLSSMKAVKLYGWEPFFRERVTGAREDELALLRRYALLRALNRILWTGTPVLVTLCTFGAFVAMDGTLDAPTAFTSLTLLNLLRFPLSALPTIFTGLIEAKVSLTRVQAFLDATELPGAPFPQTPSRRNSVDLRSEFMSPYPSHSGPPVAVGGLAVELVSGNYFWDDERTLPALRGVSLRIPEGSTVLIMGEVGSGKTALLMALLGELVPDVVDPPFAAVNGSVALCSQVPWIQNATLRDNVLFGKPYDEAWYRRVLFACALEADVQALAQGDETEIGERGINLSGGQKARVALARAVYARSDVCMLETVFEAVDEHVGAHLWRHCVLGVLRTEPSEHAHRRTTLVVTHSTKALASADWVVVMKAGQVAAQGPPSQLGSAVLPRHTAGASGSPRADSSTATGKKDDAIQGADGGKGEKEIVVDAAKKKVALMTDEAVVARGVGRGVYLQYVRAMGGSPVMAGLLAMMLLRTASDLATSRWLAWWSSGNGDEPVGVYVGVYSALSITTVLLAGLCTLVVLLAALRASRQLHEALLLSVTRSPIAFFDVTPLGRVLNRFTKDMNTLDLVLPDNLTMLLMTAFDVTGTVIIISIVSPQFLIPLPVLGFLYVMVQRYYVATSRELKRWDSMFVSPIISNFAETLEGAVSVRAFHAQQRFIALNHSALNKSLCTYYLSVSCNRWLAVRLESIGNVLVFCAAALVAQQHAPASMAGMSVSYALTVTQSLNWAVRMLSDLETNVVSVERLNEYASLPSELDDGLDATQSKSMSGWHSAASSLPAALARVHASNEDVVIAANWPSKAHVEFVGVRARYRPELEDVLKGVDLDVPAGCKLGIVGRTGSGKSTMLLVLLRLIEVSGGSIRIDGVDIRRAGLQQLRSRVAIVPQDPVIFSASLRDNLDPAKACTDAEVWRAIELCSLTEHVQNTMGGLDAVLSESGSNLSFGQRQLLCIARALLKKSALLLSDEASSGIDAATDLKVQTAIREHFTQCTTITIAHRLMTIIESDLVVVMDAGVVAESGPPAELEKKKGGLFAGLLKEMRSGRRRGSSASSA